MRTNLELVSDELDYVVVKDPRIPFTTHNIIFRASALQVIANRYRDQYGIIIQVISAPLKINVLARHIDAQLIEAKQKFPAADQIGFIFISDDDPDDVYGHALPMIWQREESREHLFFLDTTQYLSDLLQQCAIDFRCQLKKIIPQLQLWGIVGGRQRDYSSCYTDALVVLKDGLCVSSFKLLAERKLNLALSTPALNIFFAPEMLLKTAQIHSYVEASEANLNTVVLSCDETPTTLAAFRRQFDLPVTVNQSQKLFGTYTLFKPECYLRMLYEEKEKKAFEDMLHKFKIGLL